MPRLLVSLAFVPAAPGFCGLSAAAVVAQDATATPDEETQRLEREKAQATLRKERAEADKAAPEAREAEQELKFPRRPELPRGLHRRDRAAADELSGSRSSRTACHLTERTRSASAGSN